MRRAEASPAQAGLDLLALFFSLSTLRRPNGGGNEASMPSPSCLKGGDGYRDQGHPARVQGQLTYQITCNMAHLQGYIAACCIHGRAHELPCAYMGSVLICALNHPHSLEVRLVDLQKS